MASIIGRMLSEEKFPLDSKQTVEDLTSLMEEVNETISTLKKLSLKTIVYVAIQGSLDSDSKQVEFCDII